MTRRSSIAGALATAAVLVAALAGAALSGSPGTASAAEVSPLAVTAGCGKAPTVGNGLVTTPALTCTAT
ncbi:hypothetical protein TPA0907_30160 [Micromonospora humidisoli]|uniref:hypothetical protein n=1 Tax=Micromonospora sp. AKA109 TaxID=2733865 RepID=UPI0022C9C585|nr:hypothetical protein [Micromonospora sp. AKA109]GHJ08649.1 hypothetical protein TPA0907_30160 [Micromonospora sp. AKA109]